MKYNDFDLNIENHVKKLTDIADKRFPQRSWVLTISCWQDGDFKIELRSSWGKTHDKFIYRKFIIGYSYMKVGMVDREQILIEEIL